MLGIPLDVVAKRREACLHASNGVHHDLGQRTKSRQPLAHARDDHVDASQIALAFAFRAIAQTLAAALLGALLLGLDKQVRVARDRLPADHIRERLCTILGVRTLGVHDLDAGLYRHQFVLPVALR